MLESQLAIPGKDILRENVSIIPSVTPTQEQRAALKCHSKLLRHSSSQPGEIYPPISKQTQHHFGDYYSQLWMLRIR